MEDGHSSERHATSAQGEQSPPGTVGSVWGLPLAAAGTSRLSKLHIKHQHIYLNTRVNTRVSRFLYVLAKEREWEVESTAPGCALTLTGNVL